MPAQHPWLDALRPQPGCHRSAGRPGMRARGFPVVIAGRRNERLIEAPALSPTGHAGQRLTTPSALEDTCTASSCRLLPTVRTIE
jgi:hypothetical protein